MAGENRTSARSGPGLNSLFVGVVACVAVGGLAAGFAGESELLHSNIVFRIVVGGVVAAICYAVVAALWLGWHRKLIAKLGIGVANLETGQAETEKEVTARDLEVAEFMGTTTNAIEELKRRVEALEPK